MNKIEDIYEFIEECKPSFERDIDGNLMMFSIPTQHIRGESAETLLNTGIKLYKKYGNRSALSYLLENEPELFIRDSGEKTEDENDVLEKFAKEMSNVIRNLFEDTKKITSKVCFMRRCLNEA